MKLDIYLSVIIPAYNEEEHIKDTVMDITRYLSKQDYTSEIIVINDGPTDKTKTILQEISGIKTINHPYNKGYGASLKTGAKHAQYDWLLFYDADGQHKPEYISEFIKYAADHDIIIGARQGYKGPFLRQPGKKLLHIVANYLAETKIPDLNCGLRLIKKEYFIRHEHLFPNNFSLSTTSTLSFLREGLSVKYVPITINKRQGKSSVKFSDGFKTLLLIIRLIMLFSPLKIFLPLAATGLAVSLAWMAYNLINSNFTMISKSSGFLFIASLLIFLFGLLADQIAAIRRELKKN